MEDGEGAYTSPSSSSVNTWTSIENAVFNPFLGELVIIASRGPTRVGSAAQAGGGSSSGGADGECCLPCVIFVVVVAVVAVVVVVAAAGAIEILVVG
jgi:hypothetical protein